MFNGRRKGHSFFLNLSFFCVCDRLKDSKKEKEKKVQCFTRVVVHLKRKSLKSFMHQCLGFPQVKLSYGKGSPTEVKCRLSMHCNLFFSCLAVELTFFFLVAMRILLTFAAAASHLSWRFAVPLTLFDLPSFFLPTYFCAFFFCRCAPSLSFFLFFNLAVSTLRS